MSRAIAHASALSSSSSARGSSIPTGRACQPSCVHRQRNVAVRAMSDAQGKLMRKPDLKKPEAPAKKLFEEGQQQEQQQQAPEDAASPSPASAATAAPPQPAASLEAAKGMTLELQRQRAKEMRAYFQDKKLQEEINKSKTFGWTKKNEITNGRWVMFGFGVGMLTEYATGVDFINQLKLMASYLGIADIE